MVLYLWAALVIDPIVIRMDAFPRFFKSDIEIFAQPLIQSHARLRDGVGSQKAKRPVIHALVSFLQLQKAFYFSGG